MAPDRHRPSDQYVATHTIAMVAINVAASVSVPFLSRSPSESLGSTPSAATLLRLSGSTRPGPRGGTLDEARSMPALIATPTRPRSSPNPAIGPRWLPRKADRSG